MTLAVFRPMPGSVTRSSRLSGNRPSNRSATSRPNPIKDVALFRKKPVDRMISSSSARSAAAYSAADGYRENTTGVTRLTRTSVVCADRMVATASSYGVLKSSSALASG